jgi:hypothetical protein
MPDESQDVLVNYIIQQRGANELQTSFDGLAAAVKRNQVEIMRLGPNTEMSYKKGKKSVDDTTVAITQMGGRADAVTNSLSRTGRALSQLFGSSPIGQLVNTLTDLTNTIDDMGDAATRAGSKGGIGRMIGDIGGVAGGVFAGAGIYDATIGKLQGTNSGTILAQYASMVSGAATRLFGTAEQANKAFLDTARMYGLVESEAAMYNRRLKESISEYGSLTLTLLNTQRQLQSSGGLGPMGAINRAVGGVIGGAATLSAIKSSSTVSEVKSERTAITRVRKTPRAERSTPINSRAPRPIYPLNNPSLPMSNAPARKPWRSLRRRRPINSSRSIAAKRRS